MFIELLPKPFRLDDPNRVRFSTWLDAVKSGIEVEVESDIEPDDEDSAARVASIANGFIKEGGRFQDARVKEVREESVGRKIAQGLKEAPIPKPSLLDRRDKNVR